ncbi:hypothetical protein CsSME_00011478 [Camellia sinensis var. sinensis]
MTSFWIVFFFPFNFANEGGGGGGGGGEKRELCVPSAVQHVAG